ncbi:hypothetical protein JDV02_006083 [Purpureocillium takamizusanense]|uniref:Uncharacterized protein n=1 Tax=Purpureocillium takamizusanense TaxID=2060973 RepID=A0A9Q8VCE2_9HYPO|nr:uncharacterized protein JDV02_006083 [Purpureocillium takamizusanense]UNI19941.1 hypothetical protein JDV02_006083 [Purpureocillium takamizusanense]
MGEREREGGCTEYGANVASSWDLSQSNDQRGVAPPPAHEGEARQADGRTMSEGYCARMVFHNGRGHEAGARRRRGLEQGEERRRGKEALLSIAARLVPRGVSPEMG